MRAQDCIRVLKFCDFILIEYFNVVNDNFTIAVCGDVLLAYML